MFSLILTFILIHSASAGNVSIVDVYSDIDSADVTLRSGEVHTNMTIDADLIFEDKVLESRRSTIKEIFPFTDMTKVFSWNISKPRDGIYRTRITLSLNGALQETHFYDFSYGPGWQPIPGISIKDIVSDSRGISIILTPFIPQSGSEQQPVITDVEYMLVEGDTVVYRTTDRRVTVIQTTPLSKDWNVRLENNRRYSTRVKARISSPRAEVFARSKDFTATDDARLTELYRDETGASVTILGLSQVPFIGNIMFTVSKDGEKIEEIKERSPVLMSGDDETVEVTWKKRLEPGIYELSVEVLGNDGDMADKWDTVIEAAARKGADNEPSPPPSEQSPGFNIFSSMFSFIAILLLFMQMGRRKR